MSNKKGYSLVELLAVLVILAIIALISYPIIDGVITGQRKNTFKISAQGIYKAVEIHQGNLNFAVNLEYSYNNKVLTLVKNNGVDVNQEVDLTGRIVDGTGTIIVDSDSNIIIEISDGKFCASNSATDDTIEVKEGDCPDSKSPIITAKEESVTIDKGASNEITSYFNIDSNGTSGIKSTVCTSDKDGNVTNTSTLTENTHTITCTVTKNNNKTANASTTIEVKETPKYSIGGQDVPLVTTGDGLYLDSDGVYRYKGANPDNYIMLGEEEYRIMAIENQGIKVIRSSDYTTNRFDAENNRPSSTNTYTAITYYTYNNIWAKASEIKQNGVVSDIITNGAYSGTVTKPSTAYTILHNTYYSKLSSVDKYIVKDATWNVGPVTQPSPMLLETVKDEEDNWTWNGKIGLMTPSEYIQAQSPSSNGYESCLSNVYNNTSCGTDNWLTPSSSVWTIILREGAADSMWMINRDGLVGRDSANNNRGLRPVVYLSPDIQLTGSGTQGSGAFTILEVDSSN